MKIGLFFGSFNPIHIGHLIIANSVVENSDLDELWFVVSPHNPFKKKETLLDNHHRLEMVNLAIDKYPKFRASDVEFKLPQPSYTINTLTVLREKYSKNDFVLLMGKDNIQTFHKWKNYQQILEKYSIIVYPRITEKNYQYVEYPNVTEIKAPVIEISSTEIRKMIKELKNVRPLVPQEVFEYLDGSFLYK